MFFCIPPLSRTRRRLFPFVAISVALLAGCESSIDNPSPPENVDDLLSAFQSPTGQLSAEELAQLTAEVNTRVAVIQGSNRLSLLVDLSDDVGSSTQQATTTTEALSPSDPKLLAVAKLNYVCRGMSDTLDAAANGRLRMTGKVTNEGLFPVVWGTFERCIEPSSTNEPMVIDGKFFVLKRETEAGLEQLFWFDGTIEVPSAKLTGELSFAIRPNNMLDLNVLSASGNVLVGIQVEGQEVVRDRDDTWDCELAAATCRERDSGNVVALNPSL